MPPAYTGSGEAAECATHVAASPLLPVVILRCAQNDDATHTGAILIAPVWVLRAAQGDDAAVAVGRDVNAAVVANRESSEGP
jgi:hypothetical protein